MAHLAPEGPVYQAGTLSGNPLAMAAGLTTLSLISEPGFYEQLGDTSNLLMSAIQEVADTYHIPFKTQSLGGMFGIYFTEQDKITNYDDVANGDIGRFKQFFHGMLQQGIYFAPSMYEAGFVSSAHGKEEIRLTQMAAEQVIRQMQKTCA